MIACTCGKCGRKFSVKDRHAGKKTRCQRCGEAVRVPDLTPVPKPAEPSIEWEDDIGVDREVSAELLEAVEAGDEDGVAPRVARGSASRVPAPAPAARAAANDDATSAIRERNRQQSGKGLGGLGRKQLMRIVLLLLVIAAVLFLLATGRKGQKRPAPGRQKAGTPAPKSPAGTAGAPTLR